MTSGRETTPPSGFSTPLHIPNINTTERPPVTTTVFATTTPGNTPFAYRASTSTDHALMISLAFVEAKNKIPESLFRGRQRQIYNEDLSTELEYFCEDYEELKMELRPEQTRKVTPPLRTRSSKVRRQRERVVVFKEAPNRERSRFRRNIEGNRPSEARAKENERREMNLPPLLARNLVEHLSTDLSSTCKGLMERPTHGLMQKKSPLMELQMIRGITSKGQLFHLVKGINKERTKTSYSKRGEKKEKRTTPAEAPILKINQEEACTRNNISKSPTFKGREVTFLPVTKGSNSSAPVIIKAKIFGREVGRVHMDSGSSFSMIYGPVKFYTTQGIRTVLSTHEFDKIKGAKKVRETSLANTKGVISCTDAEEKIIINSKYQEQIVTIGNQLPEHFKERLQNLLRTNTNIFAWTHADMIGTLKPSWSMGNPSTWNTN
uniref:Reverse transcriptase domain-containing protein n=1 Tax=Tanacetum cinerariifolium TaxID=118510 RepID=A0A6L2MUF2_TANCI|nr:reverse transcriptase domain-containing protein [Tanacetum cinerariifolium]